ncbi:hypothetical protein DFQ28_007508 [Apophysomyces sp. BC1034]|nr:hypothetical protein DFQ30_011337 [Apophysomyces sp. BC1015]KAG0186633.1 hypothetical protein DFQ28_007508 [Apophysomyces sp. BC1034]
MHVVVRQFGPGSATLMPQCGGWRRKRLQQGRGTRRHGACTIRMNKQELIDAVAVQTGASKAQTGEALDTLLEVIKKAVSKGDSVQLIGFGSFGSGKRAARTGRNPKTGETIKIPAAKTVKFTAGKAFKDAVNKR